MTEYSDKIITDSLTELGPENCFVFLSSKTFDEKELTNKEEWMGGKYSINDIERNVIRKWMDVETLDVLFVPSSNKYLAESLEVKTDEESLGEKNVSKNLGALLFNTTLLTQYFVFFNTTFLISLARNFYNTKFLTYM